MENVISFMKEIWMGVKCTFEHIYAWILCIIGFLGSFLGESGVTYIQCLLVALCADFVFGVWKSLSQGKGFSVKKSGKFFIKGLVYMSVMCLAHLIDKIIDNDAVLCMQGIALVGVITEVWSVFSNLAIIFPQFAVFPIVQKFLLTTIAEKLNMTEDELKENIEKVSDPNSPVKKLGKENDSENNTDNNKEDNA